jgi:hypothetical protein
MSWAVDITTTKNLRKKDLDRAIVSLGENRHIPDVYPPKGKYLHVTGAGFSRHVAVEFCLDLASELRKLGYEVTVSKLRD